MGALKFKNINKIYSKDVHAVTDFNLEVEDGEFIVFIGPSGCGKSTVLRMIAGLEEISSGELYIDDKLVNNLPPVERDISIVFQDYALYGNMTVYDNVGMSLKVRHTDEVEIYDKVMNTSKFLDLKSYLNRFPNQLSGGQKQRVALGRSVAREPKVFLMDEPLSNLDAKLRASTRIEIVKLQKKLGITTIYVTHDQTEAMTMADRIVVLKNGIIQQIGTPQELYRNPTNMFVGGFMGSPQMNFVRGMIDGNSFAVGNLNLNLTNNQIKLLKDYNLKEVVLGIRSEDIVIDDTAKSDISLEIENKEYCGNYYSVTMKLNDSFLTSKIDTRQINNSDFLNVFFNIENAHFFDVNTENVIV